MAYSRVPDLIRDSGDKNEYAGQCRWNVDLTAHVLTIRACLPHLKASGEGRIVNIASTEGSGATKYNSAYVAAKTGVIDNFLKAVPDAVWTMKGKPVVDGDRVSFEWEFSGTNTGAWGDGTAATGKKFSFTGASMFSIKDGKIATQSDYYDALGFYKQLGLM